jgi:Amt family ammonium transporter
VAFKKVTSLGFVSGILAGLVVITPAAGVVKPTGAMALGAMSSIACFYAFKAKSKIGYDDSLDCFGIHGIGSLLGVLLLSFFIRDSWMLNAAAVAGKSWSVWEQLLIQMKGVGATIALATIGTLVICFLVEKTVGFRLDEQRELTGLDQSLHGEHGYGLVNSEILS